ncbi:MAG: arginine--tRNA ligase [bacterium]
MIEQKLTEAINKAISVLYHAEVQEKQMQLQKTRAEFQGDYTLVVFPLLSISRKKPEETAQDLGEYLVVNLQEVTGFNVIKGFLNLTISDGYWLSFFSQHHAKENYGKRQAGNKDPFVLEYSAPNTNKPLHLGHVRNNLLGWSVAEILKAAGEQVVKVNLVNDRGIHICKSMLAWQKWGGGKTPEKLKVKGDKLVGDYYVQFDRAFKEEVAGLTESGMSKDEAAKKAPLILEAQDMLKKWEGHDPEIRVLWERMNGWVYEGFEVTYDRMGVDFDKTYYESDTYLLGRTLVLEGLEKGVLFKKKDGSIWCDLSDEGLDEKLLLRADGTSVYMTQDLGTAQLRYDDYHPSELIYVVGNEQNYHFDVLKIVLKKLGRNWADHIRHLSYGMVELPHGKMKSREGTVVDADDLMDEMVETARRTTEELGKFDDFAPEESARLYEMLGLGALKYFILKVDPKKTMLFNPEESLDFNGNTGPFIQYTHARIKSVLRKADQQKIEYMDFADSPSQLEEKERNLVKLLYDYPKSIQQAAQSLSPALIANFAYDLAKEYNQFYHELQILREPDTATRNFRLMLSGFVAATLKSATGLLGIEVPERM